MNKLKNIIKKTFIHDIYVYLKNKRKLSKWIKEKKPIPVPHGVKQLTINEYSKLSKKKYFIETGTYYGEMVWAMRKKFPNIFSIELSDELAKKAKKRFNNFKNIKIIQGDSGKKLEELLENIDSSCLFWLDGHYSAGVTAKGEKNTPIINELNCILSHKNNHMILIDDANYFNGQDDYPTIEEIQKIANNYNYSNIELKNNIIIIHNL